MNKEGTWEVWGEAPKPVPEFGFFRKQSELMIMLPEVSKLHEIFDMFAMFGKDSSVGGSAATAARISVSDLADCLRSMGLNLSDQWLAARLDEHMHRRAALGILGVAVDQRVSFELVLNLYCQLADQIEEPSAEVVMGALRSLDPDHTGKLSYGELHRMLISMGDRLEESEVFGLLNRVSDADGNVRYEHLVREMFGKDFRSEETLIQAQIYLQAVGRNAIDMDMAKRDEFIDALRRADPLNSGFIEIPRLLALVNQRRKCFSLDELQVLTEGMEDTKNSRGINYRRFLRSIMNE
ncbi:hypothetical protein KR032_001572 [Drosophila birchii]|nr:hypothetical protein KR032_001572 [Drosophila birchii]